MPISKMSANVSSGTQLKGLKLLAAPGMFLVQKYTQYRRHQQECAKKRATERELQSLTHKIVSYFLSTCMCRSDMKYGIFLAKDFFVTYEHEYQFRHG